MRTDYDGERQRLASARNYARRLTASFHAHTHSVCQTRVDRLHDDDVATRGHAYGHSLGVLLRYAALRVSAGRGAYGGTRYGTDRCACAMADLRAQQPAGNRADRSSQAELVVVV